MKILEDIRKVLMWVETQPRVYDRIRNGYDCRVRNHRYNTEWVVTRDKHRFDVVGRGVVATVEEAKQAAPSTADLGKAN